VTHVDTAKPTTEVRPDQSLSVKRAFTLGRVSFVLALLVAAISFVGDTLVPRGATPAIGYALVPVLAGACRKRRILLGLTAACTLLTWAGLFLEPPSDTPQWMSVFDRSMVTGVLWLALLLVWRRLLLTAALAERTKAIEQAADELSRSNEELDRFASRVAHDLRGPLNTVGLAAQVLEKSSRDVLSDDNKEWIGNIQGEVRRMSELIQRLLAYGRVGSGVVRLESCDCDAVLSAVVRSLAAQLESSDATVTHDPLPTVRADPVLISELIQNLIENTIKYRSDRPPNVHISALPKEREVVFTVRDNGIGIGEGDLPTVFQPFTQLRRVGTSTGVGLGLATCKRIVQRHGGRIWVESTLGEGSTFAFSLPIGRP
jgi:signal transduction histidine kinase